MLQHLHGKPPPEGDITALHCNVKSPDESYGEVMSPAGGGKFRAYHIFRF
jgi:hypothetical protein